jgi:hypothetical protein
VQQGEREVGISHVTNPGGVVGEKVELWLEGVGIAGYLVLVAQEGSGSISEEMRRELGTEVSCPGIQGTGGVGELHEQQMPPGERHPKVAAEKIGNVGRQGSYMKAVWA